MNQPVIKKMHWPYYLVWLIPLLAAVAVGFYVHTYLKKRGSEITIRFNDASGLMESQTKVMHLGVEIGQISAVQLTPDSSNVLVHVQLQTSASDFAKQGAAFWVVRPEISYGGISGLNTVLSGPFIDSNPGNGASQSQFTGLLKPPPPGNGIRFILHDAQLEHVLPDSPVYYRGIEVGTVEDIQLSDNSDGIDFHLFVQQRYAPLVRTTSQFWIVGGFDVEGGLLTGVHMKLDSLRSLISGGVTFSSPDDNLGDPAQEGAQFPLYDEPKKEWLDWSPKIPLGSELSNPPNDQTPTNPNPLQSAIKAN
jgi:paraquat-inducible protein B